jgi:hypothetical protein
MQPFRFCCGDGCPLEATLMIRRRNSWETPGMARHHAVVAGRYARQEKMHGMVAAELCTQQQRRRLCGCRACSIAAWLPHHQHARAQCCLFARRAACAPATVFETLRWQQLSSSVKHDANSTATSIRAAFFFNMVTACAAGAAGHEMTGRKCKHRCNLKCAMCDQGGVGWRRDHDTTSTCAHFPSRPLLPTLITRTHARTHARTCARPRFGLSGRGCAAASASVLRRTAAAPSAWASMTTPRLLSPRAAA